MIKINDMEFECYLNSKILKKIVKHLAIKIKNDYKKKKPLFIVVLNGSFIFAADLLRMLETIPYEVKFVQYKSYEGTESTCQVKQIIGLNKEEIEGRDLIILEDIVDTGLTIKEILNILTPESKSIEVVTLFYKPKALIHKVTPKYVGIEIPNSKKMFKL
jgi:hypoxanthine phosphoribosyltransferase